jgi:DNA repair protein RecN (Recombination protein N)
MLSSLSIRDVVLIDRLDLTLHPGLTVLSGETGAGKSILLDSLGLALGARADSGLVREGAQQASVAASFLLPPSHPVRQTLQTQGIAVEEDELVLRRVIGADGRSRAFANDQPVSIALLRQAGAMLVEMQGQHEQMGLADPATHTGLLDNFGVPAPLRHATTQSWHAARAARAKLAAAAKAAEAASRDEEWLRHALAELTTLAPQPDEEEALAQQRQHMQQAERRAEAIASALGELSPNTQGRNRNAGPAAALRAAARALSRLNPPGSAEPAIAAIERAEEAIAEAETQLQRLAAETETSPRQLEQTEERLFALRAAGRKYAVPVADLAALHDDFAARLALIETGTANIEAARREVAEAEASYRKDAEALTMARQAASTRLQTAIARELPPLKLENAIFTAAVTPLPQIAWCEQGADAVQFLIAANPGQTPGPIAKVASGGELSRLMLALKVVLSAGSSAQTLVFDEVDSGIGGATAASVGERLMRIAGGVQVLVVTHSPQVAARGTHHLRVAKHSFKQQTITSITPLTRQTRREEIARMLAGETITEAARAAADQLLGSAA